MSGALRNADLRGSLWLMRSCTIRVKNVSSVFFFDSIVAPDLISPATGAELTAVHTMGEATFLSYTLPSSGSTVFKIAGTEIELTCASRGSAPL